MSQMSQRWLTFTTMTTAMILMIATEWTAMMTTKRSTMMIRVMENHESGTASVRLCFKWVWLRLLKQYFLLLIYVLFYQSQLNHLFLSSFSPFSLQLPIFLASSDSWTRCRQQLQHTAGASRPFSSLYIIENFRFLNRLLHCFIGFILFLPHSGLFLSRLQSTPSPIGNFTWLLFIVACFKSYHLKNVFNLGFSPF